nr:rab11 family-interacting protein 1 isoform X1 [Pogona vitticeps]
MSEPGSPVSLGSRWAPTHVQVTALQARGLRAKAKGGQGGGGSDAYAVMALGKEKFATSVAERCQGSPVWREEATFELPPAPRRGLGAGAGGGGGGGPLVALSFTVFHRALLGLDKFLGRAEISLAELQAEGARRTTRWYKLHSKPGKEEKERGEIEVDIQFMRSNMTASMFDLSMKDKSRTPFGKLKDKLKGKRGNGLPDTASAIIPSISHSPADSEEESNEKEKKKSKFKTLFSKPGLQKSTLSQSMSVLPTHQEASGRVRLRPSDFQSKWGDDDDDEDTLTPVSEKPFTSRAEGNLLYPSSGTSHKRTGSGDSRQLNQITGSNMKEPHSLFGLKSKSDPTSRSNVCINGSHIYMEVHESKSDAFLKDSTPSSPQISQRKRLFLSQENLSPDLSKEGENTGRFPPHKEPPGSSSLESFKAMTLPSYKLLSGEDLLESHNPVISETLKETKDDKKTDTPKETKDDRKTDTPKETKEDKKQENKKSGLLSLMTGRKEGKISEEVENNADTSLKMKEVKRDEKDLPRKEVNPFEVPADNKGRHGPEKSSAAEVPNVKASLNPFDESVMEEEKAGKNAISVKPSQTKPVKPRLGVSSEDETKATFPIPVPPSTSLLSPFYHSDNENNPFNFKQKQEQKVQNTDTFISSLITPPARFSNNPFLSKWEQGSKQEGVECSPSASSHVLSPPDSGKASNPFSPLWRQKSQTHDFENSAEPPLCFQTPLPDTVLESHPLPCQPSNADDHLVSDLGKGSESLNSPPTSTSVAGNLDDSKYLDVLKPQNENFANQTDSVLRSGGALALSEPSVIVKSWGDDKLHIVPPFKENSGRMKKTVTFARDELKDNDEVNSVSEIAEEDLTERWDEDENRDAIKPIEGRKRQGLDLDIEHQFVSKCLDGGTHSAYDNDNPSRTETKGLVTAEPPLPAPRILLTSPKKTNTSKAVIDSGPFPLPPKPMPRTKRKDTDSPLTDALKAEDALSTGFKKMSSDNSVSKEELIRTTTLATPESTVLLFGRDDGTMDSSRCTNNHSSIILSTKPQSLLTGDVNIKGTVLPVISEVGSDDEQLSDYHQESEKMVVCVDFSRNGGDSRAREMLSKEKVVDEKQIVSLSVKTSGPGGIFKPRKSPVSPSAVRLQNESGLEQNGTRSLKEDGESYPEFSDKPFSVSNSSQSYSVNSFQSDALGSYSTESTKKSTMKGLDAKLETSGQKKLLQARVSTSETHPNQTLQSVGSCPPKFRLHPVKPMNTTTNKQPAKTFNAKILDNQNEANIKKYDPSDPAYAYAQLTHDELIQLVLKQKDVIAKRDLQVRELQDYIDNLLVRVMEETPNILRVQAHVSKKAGKM